MDAAQRRQFVRDHRTAIFGYGRRHDGPAMTVLYYLMDGEDDLLVVTMRARQKAKAVLRDPKVSLCVLDEQWPLTYVNLYCDARVDATVEDDLDAVVAAWRRILELMAGRELDDSVAEHAVEQVRAEDRVVLRLRPYATFATPPRHVHSEADVASLTHWTSSSLPWRE